MFKPCSLYCPFRRSSTNAHILALTRGRPFHCNNNIGLLQRSQSAAFLSKECNTRNCEDAQHFFQVRVDHSFHWCNKQKRLYAVPSFEAFVQAFASLTRVQHMFQKSAKSFKGNGTVIQNRILLCMWFPLKEYAIP